MSRRSAALLSGLALLTVLLLRVNRGPASEPQPVAPTSRDTPTAPAPPTPATPQATAPRSEVATRAAVPTPKPSSPEQAPPAPETAGAAFWVRLVHAGDRTPVPNAALLEFSTGRADPEAEQTPPRELGRSDSAGLARFVESEEGWGVLVTQADGLGPALLQTDAEHPTPEQALEVSLSPAATIAIVLTGEGGLGLGGVRVRCSTPGYAIVQPDGRFVTGSPCAWWATTSEDGTCEVTGLPSAAPLTVAAYRGARLVVREPEPLVLEPGERREVRWALGSGSRIYGRLTDTAGVAEPGREVWLTRTATYARPGRARFYLTPSDGFDVAQRATTDAQGTFEFEDVPAGTWYVGAAPFQEYEAAPTVEDLAPVAVTVEVPPGGDTVEVELRAARGLFVRGGVTYPGAVAPESGSVRATSPLGAIDARVEGLSFTLGPLEPVPHRLRARFRGPGLVPSPEVEAYAGDEHVVLALGRGGRLAGRFVDGTTGERCSASILFASQDSGRVSMGITPEPDFDLDGLEPGTYDLAAWNDAGLAGLLRGLDVQPGSTQDALELRLYPGARLRVSYRGPADYAQVRILQDGALLWLDGLRSGTSHSRVVPPGTAVARVTYTDSTGRHEEEQRIELTVGEEAEIAFELP